MRSGTGQATLGGGGKDPSKPPGIGPCAAHSHGKLESVARKAARRSLIAWLPKNMRSRAIEFNTKPHGRRHGPRVTSATTSRRRALLLMTTTKKSKRLRADLSYPVLASSSTTRLRNRSTGMPRGRAKNRAREHCHDRFRRESSSHART